MAYTPLSAFAKLRARLLTVLTNVDSGDAVVDPPTPATYTIAAGRIVLGWERRGTEEADQSLYEDCKENGPRAYIGFVRGERDTQTLTGPGYVPIEVFVARDHGQSWDGQIEHDFMDRIMQALENPSLFTDCPGPNKVSGQLVYDHENSKGLVRMLFTFEFLDPPQGEAKKLRL